VIIRTRLFSVVSTSPRLFTAAPTGKSSSAPVGRQCLLLLGYVGTQSPPHDHGKGVYAQRGTVLLTAWEAAELAAIIRHEQGDVN